MINERQEADLIRVFVSNYQTSQSNIQMFQNISLISGIVRIQDFLKEAEENNWVISLYQFSGKPYRDLFWEIKKTKFFNVIIDVKRENIFAVLKHVMLFHILSLT